jgi:hypothetical protein
VLDALSESGLSGKGPSDTAEQMIRQGLASLVRDDFYRDVILAAKKGARRRSSKSVKRQ